MYGTYALEKISVSEDSFLAVINKSKSSFKASLVGQQILLLFNATTRKKRSEIPVKCSTDRPTGSFTEHLFSEKKPINSIFNQAILNIFKTN